MPVEKVKRRHYNCQHTDRDTLRVSIWILYAPFSSRYMSRRFSEQQSINNNIKNNVDLRICTCTCIICTGSKNA